VAEAGKRIATRRSSWSTGPVLEGHGLRAAARGRHDVPKIVDWYMDGKIGDRPDDHPHPALERINEPST